jgi:hypothetical protein
MVLFRDDFRRVLVMTVISTVSRGIVLVMSAGRRRACG